MTYLSKKYTGTNLLVYLDELSKMVDRGNKLDALCIQGLDKIIGTLPFLVLYLKIRFHSKY